MADNGRFGIVGIGKFTNTDEEQSWQVEGAVKYASLRIDIVHWVVVLPDQDTRQVRAPLPVSAQQPLPMIIKAAASPPPAAGLMRPNVCLMSSPQKQNISI